MSDTLSKIYLELGELLPKTTISRREYRMIQALQMAAACIGASSEHKIGHPGYEQARANIIKLLKEYGYEI